MPLFDKVKAQAAQVAQKAQEAGRAGAARIEDAQTKHQLDGLLHDLGAALYEEHAGRGGEDNRAAIDALYVQIDQLEAEHGTVSSSDAEVPESVSAPTSSGSSTTGTETGNFTL